MTKPIISVVCGTYKRLSRLRRMINSVRNTVPDSIPVEFIIADNDSDDGTWEWLESQDDVIAIQMGAPVGGIKAFTEAAKLARGEYVLIVTDDVYFPDHSIMLALGYLDRTIMCGAISFQHNKNRDFYEAAHIGVIFPDGFVHRVPYTQISLVRKWIGDRVGWWGADDAIMGQGFTYGGDNFLGAGIWEMGYTVDSCDYVYEIEEIVQDLPRKLNEEQHMKDHELYWKRYPKIHYPGTPDTLPDDEHLRILLLLHYNPQHRHHKAQKQWLKSGLSKFGLVYDYDYAQRNHLGQDINLELGRICEIYQPHLIFSQVHRVAHGFNPDTARILRTYAPNALMVNWNGDVWIDNVNQAMTRDILRQYDLLLFSNAQLSHYLGDLGFCTGYLPEGFEPSKRINQTMPRHDVVFTGSAYSEWRVNLFSFLATLPYNVGFYGNVKDIPTLGNTMWDWETTRGIYRNAQMVVSDQQFPDALGYVSKRMWEIMAAGGCVLQQYSKELDSMTGLKANEHYIMWHNLEDLGDKIAHYIERPEECAQIAQAAHDYVWQHHNPTCRAIQIFEQIGALS